MECKVSELVKRGHDQAVELKSSCGAVDVRDVAQLISDLASQLDVQRVRVEESRRELRAADETIENLQMQLNAEREAKLALAEEQRAVEEIHNEAVFITDDHYEQCPAEVQKIIRSLAVMQIPAYQAFLAELRRSAFNDLCAAFVKHKELAGLDDSQEVTVFEATDALLHCAEQLDTNICKGVQS